MYDDNFSPEQIERLPDALPPEDACLVRDLQVVYQPEADSHRRSLERVRARLAQQEARGRISLPTNRKRLEGKIISIREKKVMEDNNVSWGMNSSTPLPQAKKRSPIVRMVGISLVAAVAIITIVSFTIFSGVLRSAPQTAGNGSSTLTDAPGQQQPALQKEISNGKLVCSVGLDVRPLPSFDASGVSVSWSAQGRIAASNVNNFTLFSAKDCGAKITKSTMFYEGSWSPDGQRLVVVSPSDNALKVLDKDGNSIANIPFTKLGATFIGPVIWSSDGTKFTFVAREANNQESLKTADVANGGNVKTLMTTTGDGGTRGFGEISSDGKYIIEANLKEYSIWDVNTGKKVSNLSSDAGNGGYSAFAFSPDGSLLAQLGNGKVGIYRSADGKQQTSFNVDQDTRNLAWSHDGKYLAISGRSIGIYDVGAQKTVMTFGQVDAKHYISDIAWAPDGSGLVSAVGLVQDDGHPQASVNVWALS